MKSETEVQAMLDKAVLEDMAWDKKLKRIENENLKDDYYIATVMAQKTRVCERIATLREILDDPC